MSLSWRTYDYLIKKAVKCTVIIFYISECLFDFILTLHNHMHTLRVNNTYRAKHSLTCAGYCIWLYVCPRFDGHSLGKQWSVFRSCLCLLHVFVEYQVLRAKGPIIVLISDDYRPLGIRTCSFTMPLPL